MKRRLIIIGLLVAPHYRTDWRAAGVGAAWGAGIGAVFGLALPYESWHRVIR